MSVGSGATVGRGRDGVSKISGWSRLRQSAFTFVSSPSSILPVPHDTNLLFVPSSLFNPLLFLSSLLPLQGPGHFSYRFSFHFHSLFSSAALPGILSREDARMLVGAPPILGHSTGQGNKPPVIQSRIVSPLRLPDFFIIVVAMTGIEVRYRYLR